MSDEVITPAPLADEIARLRGVLVDRDWDPLTLVGVDSHFIDLRRIARAVIASWDARPPAEKPTEVSIDDATKRLPGATWFLRCGECRTMYVAIGGWNIFTGKDGVAWGKPKEQRKPTKCVHPIEKAQWWNGSEWVAHIDVDEGVVGG